MTRNEIQKEEDTLNSQKQEVLFQLEKAEKEKIQAEARITELDAMLPDLLAGIALKKIPSSKGMRQLVQNKGERAEQQGIVDRYEPLKRGLEVAGKKLRHPLLVLDRKNQLWNEYDKVKSEILAHPHDRHHDIREAKLLRLAAYSDLNCVENVKTFLGKLREDKTPKD